MLQSLIKGRAKSGIKLSLQFEGEVNAHVIQCNPIF